jgi:phosphoglycolate phosphatase
VLFDLDGTLLDTLTDIAHAANSVLDGLGLPTHPDTAYRQFIGEGVAVLFRRALGGGDEALVDRCVAAFRAAYGRSWNVHTRPYDGIPELLDALAARGVELTLLSNKPDAFTRLCADHFLAKWPFRVVLGARDGVPRKPDPTAALEVAARLGLEPGAFAYLGDSAVDMQTTRRAGMHPVGASWGFRPLSELIEGGAEVVIDHPGDLLGVLSSGSPSAAEL